MESPELSQAQLQILRERLVSLLDELAGSIENLKESAQPVDLDMPIGRLSRVDALQQQSMAKANRAAIEVRMKKAKLAFTRLAAGDYGFCVVCDEPVAFKRLKARPETTTCVTCQSEVESRRS